MRLYQLQTPAGQPHAQAAFEATLLQRFGGYSASERSGAWTDPRDGMVYLEPVRVYEIATTDEMSDRFEELAALVTRHYPEEKAVFVADVGRARIIRNGTPMHRAPVMFGPDVPGVRLSGLDDGGIHRIT